MKLSLVEYIDKQNSDICQQRQSLSRLEHIIVELKGLFESFDTVDTVTKHADKVQSEDKNINRNDNSSPKLSTFESQSKILNSFLLNDNVSRIDLKKTMRDKAEQYRNELLKQIEERTRIRELKSKHAKEKEEDLERKISQQRLALYNEYLEEQRKGEFLSKTEQMVSHDRGANNCDVRLAKLPSTQPSYGTNYVVHCGSSPAMTDCIQLPQAKLCPTDTDENNNREANILANLNEVRKIMQNDHIEMLEKLLNV